MLSLLFSCAKKKKNYFVVLEVFLARVTKCLNTAGLPICFENQIVLNFEGSFERLQT